MDLYRIQQLKKNFLRMFFVRAFLNLRTINAVMSIFYLHRGVSLSEIFYMGLMWAGAVLLFEVPSSYLADLWGRKKTMLLGIIFSLLQWVIFLFAHDFWWFAFGMFLYGISFACFSGTDEALLYDTEKELGQESGTLAKLGKYKAAVTTFKIITPILGALIAKDLTESQFIVILGIDIAGCVVAFILTCLLIEPQHRMDIHNMQTGVFSDGLRVIRQDPFMIKSIFNKEFVFFAIFIPWCYYQSFYVDLGLSIIVVGVGYGIKNLASFLGQWHVRRLTTHDNFTVSINRLNIAVSVSLLILIILLWISAPAAIIYFFLLLAIWAEDQRQPFFSELYHKRFASFNRATTLSLTNLLHNIIEFPLLIAAGALIAYNQIYPYYFSFLLALIVLLFLQLQLSSPKNGRTATH